MLTHLDATATAPSAVWRRRAARRSRTSRPVLTSDAAAGYAAGPNPRAQDTVGPGHLDDDAIGSSHPDEDAVNPAQPGAFEAAQLEAALDSLDALDLDGCSDATIRELLRRMKRPQHRLSALQARWAGELEHRAVTSAPPGRQEQAAKGAQRQLAQELNLRPSEAKATSQTGRHLRSADQTRERFEAGDISQDHATVITDTLRHVPGDRKAAVEAELLEAAVGCDPNALRRAATRILGREDLEAAEQRERRQHARRSGRMADDPDGALHLSLRLYGTDAEFGRTALHAFMTHDGRQERRTDEQRLADAFVDLCSVALRSGEAPTQHGIRPHVIVVVQMTELARLAGMAELGYAGPVTISEVLPLLQDASVTMVTLDDDNIPRHISEARRSIPAALWKALVARDGGCTWRGCDAPVAWCQVAHGNVPYRLNGKLKLSNAALLCRRHHRTFDDGGWRMQIRGGEVTYERDPTMPSVRERTLAHINAPPG
jgi:hypothetical protein